MRKKLLIACAAIAFSHAAVADEGNWLVRVRAVDVQPEVNSELSNGQTAKIGNSWIPELDITRFFTPNIAAELVLGTTRHDVSTSGGLDAGSVWLLPPTLTMQYHFTQWETIAKPYIGAGVNYTVFYDAHPGQLVTAHYQDGFGAALQAGVDIPIKDNWYFNLDVKKIYLSTVAKFDNSAVRGDVNINPWLFGAGVGYRF